MVEIPPGRFLMGDRKERVHFPQVGRWEVVEHVPPLILPEDGEGPVRPVHMSGFYLDQFEVRHSSKLLRKILQATFFLNLQVMLSHSELKIGDFDFPVIDQLGSPR